MHKLFPSSTFFDFETIRILGTTVYGGAEAAEVLEAVGDIKPNDPITWEKAWSNQAARAELLAQWVLDESDSSAVSATQWEQVRRMPPGEMQTAVPASSWAKTRVAMTDWAKFLRLMSRGTIKGVSASNRRFFNKSWRSAFPRPLMAAVARALLV
ncbi:hypothetical protein LX36DRAFT_706863 [Colletotrichum falcatum]|nr:hypothetical protein LX36DRAFT_706863 [Colletotrichum falcatum]